MGKQWTLTQKAFERLLTWLDKDRERAGQMYVEIRSTLVKFFAWRGCPDAEEMADETINRVNRRLGEVPVVNDGNPRRYFFGVAKNVLREWQRKEKMAPLPHNASTPPEAEDEAEKAARLLRECLASCLRGLPDAERRLVLDYYEKSKQAKIDFRKALARQLNVEPTALRVKVHRIRARLQKCVEECVARKGGR
jgi:RNA polymerase sigma factor (sigma-70 family)